MIEASSILWISAVSFLVSLILTPLARNAFLRQGLLDRPDGVRKLHARPVPRVGGIPIVTSYVAAYIALLAAQGPAATFVLAQAPFVIRLLPAIGLIFLIGFLDDIYGLPPWQKLLGQMTGAAVAVWAGVRIWSVGGHRLDNVLSVAVTLVWLVGCTNALNLIDGLDGLASGMGMVSTLTMFAASIVHHDYALALATLPLCGSLLAFLRYNFNPASVFLGDSGSLLIGFLLGCYGAIWSQKAATLLGITAPLMAMAIPLLDVLLSVIRRWLRGRPIFSADRHHIHHKLLDRGLTHRGVVLVLYLVCGIYAVLSLLASISENHLGGLMLILFCALTWIGIQNLGYFEFGLAGRFLLSGAFRRTLHAQITLHGLERALDQAASERECWVQVESAARELGFVRLHARFNGQRFRHDDTQVPSHLCWQMRLPLPEGDWINLSRRIEPGQPVSAGPLMDTLIRLLPVRLAAFRAGLVSPAAARAWEDDAGCYQTAPGATTATADPLR